MAHEIKADLIMLGTHGRTGLRRLLTGSVAEAVLRDTACLVPPLHSSAVAGAAGDLRVILHPTDLSECSESALAVARFLAREHGAQLIVLHVAPMEVLVNETGTPAMDPQIYQCTLKNKCAELDGPDLEHRVKTQMKHGDAVAEILEEAEATGCDLIVMGTCGRWSLGRLLLGSVAEGVLRGARCPVLAVKMPVPAAMIAATRAL